MNLLVSLDENYLPQLQVLLASLCQNCPGGDRFRIPAAPVHPPAEAGWAGREFENARLGALPYPVGESLFSKRR